MALILSIAVVLSVAYCLLIHFFLRHWHKIPLWQIPADFQPHTFVSVIIPARNEAANIQECLYAVLAQNYPVDLMEVIVIDDHSEDATPALVQAIADPRIRLIHLAHYPLPEGQAFKKHGINTAIAQARGTLMLCTDADCYMGREWISGVVSFYQNHPVQMIAGPVNFHRERSFLERFQSLDFLGMMVLTGAGLHSGLMRMGNGANLAYTRAAFNAVDGFRGVDHLASGDDVFLMHKIEKQYPGQVQFLKSLSAIVLTLAMPDWRAFFHQRLRWGTKNANYTEWRIIAVLGLVFGLCWSILLCLLLLPLAPSALGMSLLLLTSAKVGADYRLLRTGAVFFQRQDLLRIFWPAQVAHILYIAVIGLCANLYEQYEWKGRKVK